MVQDLHRKVMENKNVRENLEFYQSMSKRIQNNCEGSHLPVILGYSFTTKVYNAGHPENLEYKKCLLCGKDISLESREYDFMFDASNYGKTTEYEDYDKVLKRYEVILNLFTELSFNIDTQEELFAKFDAIINPEGIKKIRKR